MVPTFASGFPAPVITQARVPNVHKRSSHCGATSCSHAGSSPKSNAASVQFGVMISATGKRVRISVTSSRGNVGYKAPLSPITGSTRINEPCARHFGNAPRNNANCSKLPRLSIKPVATAANVKPCFSQSGKVRRRCSVSGK